MRELTRSAGQGRLPTDNSYLRSLDWVRRLTGEVDALDRSVYDAISATPTPTLDKPVTRLSNAANSSLLWMMVAILVAAFGGVRGRRAALRGLTAIGLTSLVTNVAAKHAFRRRRPHRAVDNVRSEARMPTSSSFPSGHTASAFAFAAAATADVPELSLVMYGMASLVGFSRVLTGVHFPSDVIGGGVLGLVIGTATRGPAFEHRRGPISTCSDISAKNH